MRSRFGVLALLVVGACDATVAMESPRSSDGGTDASTPPSVGPIDVTAPDASSEDSVEGGVENADAATDGEAGPEVCAAPTTHGGTRLQPIHWTTADGLDVVAGLWDPIAQRECVPTGNACQSQPLLTTAWIDGATDRTYVVVGPAGLANRSFYQADSVLGSVVATLGSEIVPTPASVTVTGGQAMAIQAGSAAAHVYRLGAAAPSPSPSFVSVERCVDANLDVSLFEGADGSQVVIPSVSDRTRHAALFPHDDGTGLMRWLPPDGTSEAGALCDVQLQLPVPNWAWTVPDPFEVLYQGKAYALKSVTLSTNCQVEEPPTPHTFYILGDEIPLSSYDVAPSTTVGDQRLTLTVPTVNGSALVGVRPLLHDGAIAADCQPERASDGTTRCLPPSKPVYAPNGTALVAFTTFVAFSDASCTQPIVVSNEGAPKFARQPLSTMGDACASDVYSVGSAIDPAQVDHVYGAFTNLNGYGTIVPPGDCGSCAVLDQYVVYGMGASLYAATIAPPATFASVSIETRR